MTNKTIKITDPAVMLRNKLPFSPSKCNFGNKSNYSAKPSLKICRGNKNKKQFHLYKCHLCNFDTKSRNCIRVHLEGSHGVCEMYCCSYNNCNFESRNLQKLIKHLCIVHSDRFFTCKKCGNQFKRKNSLVQHIRTHSVKEQERPETIEKYKLRYSPQQKCQKTRRKRLTCKSCKWKETPNHSLGMHTQLLHSVTRVNLQRAVVKYTSEIHYGTENPVSVENSTTIQLRNKTVEKEVQYLCTKTSNVPPTSISQIPLKNVSNKVGKADLKNNPRIKILKENNLKLSENRKARAQAKSKLSTLSPQKKFLHGEEFIVKKKLEISKRKISRKRKLGNNSLEWFESIPPLEWLAQNRSFKLDDFLRTNRFQRKLCDLEYFEVLAIKTSPNGTVHYQVVWHEPVLNSNIVHENVAFDFDEEIDRLFFGREGHKIQISPNKGSTRNNSQNQIAKAHDSEAVYAVTLDHPYCKVEDTNAAAVDVANGMNLCKKDETEFSDQPRFKLVSNELNVLVE